MTKTVYIGMDVHSTNYTLSSYTCEADNCFSTVKLGPDCEKYSEVYQPDQKGSWR